MYILGHDHNLHVRKNYIFLKVINEITLMFIFLRRLDINNYVILKW